MWISVNITPFQPFLVPIYSSSHYLHNLESLLIFGSCEFLAPRRSSYDCPYTTMLHNVLSIAFAMKQQFFSDMLLKPNKRTRPPKNFDFQLIPLFFPVLSWPGHRNFRIEIIFRVKRLIEGGSYWSDKINTTFLAANPEGSWVGPKSATAAL